MEFSKTYTTNEKITKEEADKKVIVKTETAKTILSNDAYAVGEVLVELTNKIEHARLSLIK